MIKCYCSEKIKNNEKDTHQYSEIHLLSNIYIILYRIEYLRKYYVEVINIHNDLDSWIKYMLQDSISSKDKKYIETVINKNNQLLEGLSKNLEYNISKLNENNGEIYNKYNSITGSIQNNKMLYNTHDVELLLNIKYNVNANCLHRVNNICRFENWWSNTSYAPLASPFYIINPEYITIEEYIKDECVVCLSMKYSKQKKILCGRCNKATCIKCYNCLNDKTCPHCRQRYLLEGLHE